MPNWFQSTSLIALEVLLFDIRWFSHGDTPEINNAIGDYVSGKVWGITKPFFLSTTMGVFEDGALIAGMVFHNYDRGAEIIEISGASETPRWLTRTVLWEMFSYPFEQMNCQAVVMRVSNTDARLARMLPSYGFVKYEIPRLRGRDKSEMIYVLHDDIWRENGFHKARA